MLLIFIILSFVSPNSDIKLYNQYDTLLQDKLIIITKGGDIYNYDLKYEQIRWHANLGISLLSNPHYNGTHVFQPQNDGNFIIQDFGQYYKITPKMIDLMFKQCSSFQNHVTYDSSLIYFIDIASGNLKQLTQYDIQQLLSQPKLYEKGVIISIDQKYILDLEQEESNQHSSRISMNFLFKYLRGDKTQKLRSNTTTITKRTYGLMIDKNDKTIDLHLDDEVFEIFGYENNQLYSHQLIETGNSMSIIYEYQGCEVPGQCQSGLKVYELSSFKQCINFLIQQQTQSQLEIYKPQSCEIPTQPESENQEEPPYKSDIYIYLLSLSCLFLLVLYLKKSPQIKEKVVYKDVKTIQYVKTEEITIDKSKIIGVGTYGTIVYEGTLQGRPVAVKQMKKTNIINPKLVTREVEIQKNLNSQNIVKIYWYEETHKYIRLAMEKCKLTLRELVDIDTNKRLTMEEKLKLKAVTQGESFYQSFLFKMLQALDQLNQQQIIHRDIRPDNILFTELGEPKLADFGLSKIIDNSKHTQDIGSVGWRAREIILNQKYTIKADVFSLGCIFYYLYSGGTHPFGKTNIEQKIMEDRPNKIKCDTPEMNDIVWKLISKTRKQPHEYFNHPYFWTKQRKLNFICEFSDYLETFDQIGRHANNLQTLSKQIYGDQWSYKVAAVIRYQNRKYDDTQFRQLIRLIRNVKHHYHELKEECKYILGPNDETSYTYWSNQFPNLFFELYNYAIEYKWGLLTLSNN